MKLYILRHADAAAGFPDHERPLTQKGIDQITDLTQRFPQKAAKELGAIWHSPLVRAAQTAECFKKGLGLTCPLQISESLHPGGPIESLASELESLNQDPVLVGHNPHCELLSSFLLKRSSHPPAILFKKAGLLCLEYSSDPEQPWILRWYLIPSLF